MRFLTLLKNLLNKFIVDMPRVRYTKTYFKAPEIISESEYKRILKLFSTKPYANIDSASETFGKRFSGSFMTIGVCILLITVCGAIMDGKDGFLVPIMGISMFVIVLTLVNLLLEGPSYSKYLAEKDAYFKRMKSTIQITSSYYEFIKVFY